MRKYFLDNIRSGIVLLVVFYHVIYLFNSVGVISNIGVHGIMQMDTVLYFIYPWFMACLFVVAGISARYSLQHRTAGEFVKERVKKLLVPSIAGVFILGWICGYITNKYVDMFGGNGEQIPAFIRYLIFCLSGFGPLWFAHELFLVSMILLLIRILGRKDFLYRLCGKANMPVLLLLAAAVWGSAQILNTPLITVYRHGIYIFMFLLGYYLFSHDAIQDILVKWKLPLLAAAIVCGIAYTMYYYGKNYAEAACLQSWFTNVYAWLMILAVLGCGKAWLNKNMKFTEYMAPRSFGIYVLHYPFLVLFAYLLTTYTELSMIWIYIVLLIAEMAAIPVLYEIIYRIPAIRFLLLGISKK